MRKRYFTGLWISTTSYQGHIGNGMVRLAKRQLMNNTTTFHLPSSRMNLSRFQCLGGAHGGSMLGNLLASMVLPAPGGPINSMLCPPAAATSLQRLMDSCPLHLQSLICFWVWNPIGQKGQGDKVVLMMGLQE